MKTSGMSVGARWTGQMCAFKSGAIHPAHVPRPERRVPPAPVYSAPRTENALNLQGPIFKLAKIKVFPVPRRSQFCGLFLSFLDRSKHKFLRMERRLWYKWPLMWPRAATQNNTRKLLRCRHLKSVLFLPDKPQWRTNACNRLETPLSIGGLH